jgi:hypothetical protein
MTSPAAIARKGSSNGRSWIIYSPLSDMDLIMRRLLKNTVLIQQGYQQPQQIEIYG